METIINIYIAGSQVGMGQPKWVSSSGIFVMASYFEEGPYRLIGKRSTDHSLYEMEVLGLLQALRSIKQRDISIHFHCLDINLARIFAKHESGISKNTQQKALPQWLNLFQMIREEMPNEDIQGFIGDSNSNGILMAKRLVHHTKKIQEFNHVVQDKNELQSFLSCK